MAEVIFITKTVNYSEYLLEKMDRQPAVAGTFYPANPAELRAELEHYFYGLISSSGNHPVAIIVPHAGYVYSAAVAAKAMSQLNRNASFERIFLIGSSHTTYFEGVSVYTSGDFITPLGKVEVDSLSAKLAGSYSLITSDPQTHVEEHSLEVQLPLLQYWLIKPFRIVPVIIGGNSEVVCQQLAEILDSYFNSKNLFVISTDFSHYPSYANAVKSDNLMAEAILSKSPRLFLDTKKHIEHLGITNLVTAACGWTSVLTLLYITENKADITIHKVAYRNSGDSPWGEKDKVVGYNAFCVV